MSSSLKREHSAFQNLKFFTSVGHFCPQESGTAFPMRIRITPTKIKCGSLRIRILNTEKVPFWCCFHYTLKFLCCAKHTVPNIPVTRVKDLKMQWSGSGMWIPDPNFFNPGSKVIRIPDQEPHQRIFVYFNPKNCLQPLGNMIRVVHPGSGSWF